MLAFGAIGGALGVVVAGFAALVVARRAATADLPTASVDARGSDALWATLAFLALAVVQNQDVVLANALLPAGEAGRFAVLSPLGGAAAFAPTPIPPLLVPRAPRGAPP